MALNLTNLSIKPLRGNAALLPNQPILQGCVVSASESATLVPGDIVTLATGGKDDQVVVKKAAATDVPCGVVVGNPIKTGFVAGDRVSVFGEGAYVYMEAADASIARGTKCQFDSNGKLKKTTTAGNGYIGVTMTATTSAGDLAIVNIIPGKLMSDAVNADYVSSAISTALTAYQPKLTAGDFVAIDADTNTITTTYTAGTGIEISAAGEISAS